MGDVIRDGQTIWGFIKAQPRLHAALLFRYRPFLPETVELTERALRDEEPDKATQFLAAQLSQHLVEWDASDLEGEGAALNFESLRCLRYPVLSQLHRIVAGLKASDPHPKVSADAAKGQRSYADDVIAQAKGDAPGQERLEETVGNSNGG